MNREKIKRLEEYVADSFLKPLLIDDLVTDISYNGKSIFYQHNELGRQKSEISISVNEINDFLRHIANLGEKQFSFSEPLLDMSFGRFRLNAVHYSIGRLNDEKIPTFSLRIGSLVPRIVDNGCFMPKAISRLLEILICNQLSIVIGGQTGVGKTELQKYLLSLIPINSRVVVIDNIQELTYNSANAKIDLNCWQVNSHIGQASFQELIRNALRSNPDWLIIAESRGKEMLDVLNAVMTGHPVITTIHAKSAETIANRMVRMILMNGSETIYSEALNDIKEHFRYFLFLEKNVPINGKIYRYLAKILEYDHMTNQLNVIYQKRGDKSIFAKPSLYLLSLIRKSPYAKELTKEFIS